MNINKYQSNKTTYNIIIHQQIWYQNIIYSNSMMSIGWVALSSLVCRRRHFMSYHIISCHIMLHKTHDLFYIFGKKRTQGYLIQWHQHINNASSAHQQCIIAKLSPVYCCRVLSFCLFVPVTLSLSCLCPCHSVSSLKCHSVFLDALASLDFTLVSE